MNWARPLIIFFYEKLFLSRMMGSKQFKLSLSYPSQIVEQLQLLLCKFIADTFPPWHCVNTHLNSPDKQTDKTSVFTEAVILDDHEECLINSNLANMDKKKDISVEAVRVHLVFQVLMHF